MPDIKLIDIPAKRDWRNILNRLRAGGYAQAIEIEIEHSNRRQIPLDFVRKTYLLPGERLHTSKLSPGVFAVWLTKEEGEHA